MALFRKAWKPITSFVRLCSSVPADGRCAPSLAELEERVRSLGDDVTELKESVRRLERIRDNVAELQESVRTLEQKGDIGAQFWGQRFIKAVTGEAVKLLLDEDRTFPSTNQGLATSAAAALSGAAKIQIDGYGLRKKFEKIVNDRNSSVHCDTVEEVRDQVCVCMKLDHLYPGLRMNTKDQYLVLKNFELLVKEFRHETLTPC